MELYTTLVHTKRAMNGGVLPPMTPVPENVLHFIDPAFTPGMGAMEEDAEMGIRCPVRECGRYFHRLERHLDRKHADIGGQAAVRRALSIPHTASLHSARERSRATAHLRALNATRSKGEYRGIVANMRAVRRQNRRGPARSAATMGMRNLRSTCEAQVKHALIDVANSLGRSPNYSEAVKSLGLSWTQAVRRLYGGWDNVIAQCGLETVKRQKLNREDVIAGLSAWYEQHRELPTRSEAVNPERTPLIPSAPSIMKSLGTEDWRAAMEIVASVLNIYGGRYGLPERANSTAA